MAVAIQHIIHQHPLTRGEASCEFECDGCGLRGKGSRYRCQTCNFNLHEKCATCPFTLSSFLHPRHPLTLAIRQPRDENPDERQCYLCSGLIEEGRIYYKCMGCQFNVHSVCAQLPQHVHNERIHRGDHCLILQLGQPGQCIKCRKKCHMWRYTCGICRINVHIGCHLRSQTVRGPIH